jgi:hypothetical protein
MKCVGVILARDEADRYLAATIQSMQPVCDRILLLDDGSTDGTPDLAMDMGCEVRVRDADAPMWGQEASARAELWAWGAEAAGDGWLYVSDADHELVVDPAAWRMMLSSWAVTAWGIPLYDCWDSPQRHRADGQWAAYQMARPWLFRPSACPDPLWTTRGIHSGHAPANFPYHLGIAPQGTWIRHYGWMQAADRETKLARYLSVSESLSAPELAHLQSVAHVLTDPTAHTGCP